MSDRIEDLKNNMNTILTANNLPTSRDIPYYDKLARFNVLDPYNKFTYGKEYLFFTKPDCHIVEPNTMNLNPALSGDPFFIDLKNRLPGVITQLQASAGSTPNTVDAVKSPFMNLLCNSKTSTLELPGMSATTMDGPANLWGGSNTYRKDAWNADENIEFSIEFEDTKNLDIYNLLKAYEMYHRYKMAGYIYPPNLGGAAVNSNGVYYDTYTAKKELHDVFGIYKFIVDDDYTNILYYAYICGAYFVNVPRDAFNSVNGTTEGIKYTVDFKAFYVNDADPTILADFNALVTSKYGTPGTNKEVPLLEHSKYNSAGNEVKYSNTSSYKNVNPKIVGTWPTFPLVTMVNRGSNSGLPDTMNYNYQLHWFK